MSATICPTRNYQNHPLRPLPQNKPKQTQPVVSLSNLCQNRQNMNITFSTTKSYENDPLRAINVISGAHCSHPSGLMNEIKGINVGKKASIMAGSHSQASRLIPESFIKEAPRPPKRAFRCKGTIDGQHTAHQLGGCAQEPTSLVYMVLNHYFLLMKPAPVLSGMSSNRISLGLPFNRCMESPFSIRSDWCQSPEIPSPEQVIWA